MTDSPCTLCISDAPCPCPERLRWEAATLPPEPAPCATCLDADWLILSGEAWEQVAARLHMAPASLSRHLARHGRDDLIPRRSA